MTTQEVARVSHVPGGYLAKVLQSLGRAGLVEARRGLRGGYVLTRPLNELTVYDVIQAVDPLKEIRVCPLRLQAQAQRSARCIKDSMTPSCYSRTVSSRRPLARY